MEFDTLEIVLLVIMFCLGFAAIFVTKKKPAPKEREVEVTTKTLKMAEGWMVFAMDKEGNCVNSAQIPQSEESFIIGTSPDADFRILNRFVSRRHLIVTVTDEDSFFSDNNSSYSTFCKGTRVSDGEMKNKQVVWLADSPIIFIAPGTSTDEQMLKALLKNDIDEHGIPKIEKA